MPCIKVNKLSKGLIGEKAQKYFIKHSQAATYNFNTRLQRRFLYSTAADSSLPCALLNFWWKSFENISSRLLKSGACDYITSIMCTFIWSAAHGFPCATKPLFRGWNVGKWECRKTPRRSASAALPISIPEQLINNSFLIKTTVNKAAPRYFENSFVSVTQWASPYWEYFRFVCSWQISNTIW